MKRLPIVIAALAASLIALEPAARACGCFTQPSPAQPVLQAGERILFAHDGDNVVAHIQIQYQGRADEFGWIVPLPSVPTVEIGTDELFTKLERQTTPSYQLTTTRQFCEGGSSSFTSSQGGFGCSADEASEFYGPQDLGSFSADLGSARDLGALVKQDSIGPFDYAVLKADDKTEMLQWLDDNRYFVPDALGDALTPYIHPGGFFLALKLRGGQSTGDIVPIVVKYKSDLPMIPITLTQVGAIPDMGILVWVLGEARAIPRNYRHVVLNELPIWFGSNYARQVVSALKEAPGRKAFMTEYAGTSGVMSRQLDYPGRFGSFTELRNTTDPAQFLSYLRTHDFTFDATLYAVLLRYLPIPASLVAQGVRPQDYYGNYTLYQSQVRGDPDAGSDDRFDAAACAGEIQMRIVEPSKRAAKLFTDHSYLTRMYANLSPEDMNLDPVFSENPDLPDVSLGHSATLTFPCRGDAWLNSDQGFEAQYPSNRPPIVTLPPTLKRERLREAGAPQVEIDNSDDVRLTLGPVDHGSNRLDDNSGSSGGGRSSSGCGCRVGEGPLHANVALLLGAAGLIIFIRRRRLR